MRLAWLWLALPIGFQFVNGCAAPPDAPNMHVELDAIETKAGHCLVGSSNASFSCWVMDITVTNLESYGAASMWASHWVAVDDSGKLWRDPFVEGPSSVQPDDSQGLRLGFAVPTAVVLVRLDWSAHTQTISIPLPEV